jgi:hypothetical protein
MEKKQTAVEWLMPKVLELNLQLSLRRISQRNCELEILRLIEQAKQMEKEQIIDAHIEGQRVFDKHPHTQWTNDQAEQYYNETYGRHRNV